MEVLLDISLLPSSWLHAFLLNYLVKIVKIDDLYLVSIKILIWNSGEVSGAPIISKKTK